MSPNPFLHEDCEKILAVRLLIARAAQNDSLKWWEDDSLTEAGRFLLKRLFPNEPECAGKKLALKAAAARHKTMFQDRPKAIHLFRLDFSGDVELALRACSPEMIRCPDEPIRSIEDLKKELTSIVGPLPEIDVLERKPDGSVRIRSKGGIPIENTLRLARGYLDASINNSVFPYIGGD